MSNSTPTLNIQDLQKALEKCRDKFLHYEQIHRLKCTAEGDEKADRNREMADMCDAALASKPLPPTDDVRATMEGVPSARDLVDGGFWAGLEAAARWHDEQAAKHAALQATAELVGGDRQIGTLKVGAGRMIYSHDSLRRDHNEAAAAIRALSAQSPPPADGGAA